MRLKCRYWLVVIGGIANPCVFVAAAFDPNFWEKTAWNAKPRFMTGDAGFY
jgi:hypothetical protein